MAMARIEQEAARMGVLVEDPPVLARLDEVPQSRRGRSISSRCCSDAADDARAVAPDRAVSADAASTSSPAIRPSCARCSRT